MKRVYISTRLFQPSDVSSVQYLQSNAFHCTGLVL